MGYNNLVSTTPSRHEKVVDESTHSLHTDHICSNNGQWQTQAVTTWGYTPTTYWYSQDTTIITITSLVPCQVTSYTTVYQCESCGYTTPPAPVCLTCPAKLSVVETQCDSYGQTVTVPYNPWDTVVATSQDANGQAVIITTAASACCAFTTPGEPTTVYGSTYPFHLNGNSNLASKPTIVNSNLILGLWFAISALVGAGMIAL